MPLFPSAAWMEAFCDAFVGHPRAPAVADALDGVYRFVVEPAGPLAERATYDVRIGPGESRPVAHLVDDGVPPRLQIAADYRRWQQLVEGELDIGLAVMLRRVKVSGDLTGLLSRLDDTGPLLESLQQVETEWLDG